MLWGIEFDNQIEITLQKVIVALTAILEKIFGFIADSEGWVD